jgi:hypothetical protein
MQLGQTQQYRNALQALQTLKGQLGITPELQAIATYLLHTDAIAAPKPNFPFVGIDDPRDQSVVHAYNQAWQQFLGGDEE